MFNYLKRNFLVYVVFLLLMIWLLRILGINFTFWSSSLLNKPLPSFSLPLLEDPSMQLNEKVFQGQVSLLNVWATWCGVCRAEHPFLMDVAKSNEVAVYGVNYRDEAAAAKQWLDNYNSPYRAVGFDASGAVGRSWGVYAVPKSFLIDKHGVVRYVLTGPITPEVWASQLKPWISELQQEN